MTTREVYEVYTKQNKQEVTSRKIEPMKQDGPVGRRACTRLTTGATFVASSSSSQILKRNKRRRTHHSKAKVRFGVPHDVLDLKKVVASIHMISLL